MRPAQTKSDESFDPASICCIGPVILSAVGAGAMGAAAASFEAYRPVLLTITVVLVGAAVYTMYRPSAPEGCGPEGTCRPASSRVARIGLWLATLLVILLVTFPYYVGFFV